MRGEGINTFGGKIYMSNIFVLPVKKRNLAVRNQNIPYSRSDKVNNSIIELITYQSSAVNADAKNSKLKVFDAKLAQNFCIEDVLTNPVFI